MNAELKNYFPIADMLYETYGKNCEVVIHDLTKPESSVIYVANGTVTGRQIGQSFDHLVKQVLLNKGFNNDHLSNYLFSSTEGKLIKSSSVMLRNSEDEVIGMLCINMDISALTEFRELLNNYLDVDQSSNTSDSEESDVPQDVMSIIDEIIYSIIGTEAVKDLSRARCIEFIRFMDEKGIFLVKGSIDKVAAILGVSRVTVYSYLDEARGKR